MSFVGAASSFTDLKSVRFNVVFRTYSAILYVKSVRWHNPSCILQIMLLWGPNHSVRLSFIISFVFKTHCHAQDRDILSVSCNRHPFLFSYVLNISSCWRGSSLGGSSLLLVVGLNMMAVFKSLWRLCLAMNLVMLGLWRGSCKLERFCRSLFYLFFVIVPISGLAHLKVQV